MLACNTGEPKQCDFKIDFLYSLKKFNCSLVCIPLSRLDFPVSCHSYRNMKLEPEDEALGFA